MVRIWKDISQIDQLSGRSVRSIRVFSSSSDQKGFHHHKIAAATGNGLKDWQLGHVLSLGYLDSLEDSLIVPCSYLCRPLPVHDWYHETSASLWFHLLSSRLYHRVEWTCCSHVLVYTLWLSLQTLVYSLFLQSSHWIHLKYCSHALSYILWLLITDTSPGIL